MFAPSPAYHLEYTYASLCFGKVESSNSGVGTGRMALGKVLTAEARGPKFEPRHPSVSPPHTHTGKAETGGSLGHGEQPASLNQEVSGSVRDSLRE